MRRFIEATVRASALPTLALTLVALTSLPATAGLYNSMVVFGDSLSDSGNNALVIGTDPGQVITGNTYVPTFPYASGVYSNGPVWASDAASALGVPLSPSLAGGTNYAFGGATTGPAMNSFPYSLLTQASQYLGSTGNHASPNALYVVEGGGNDARAALTAIAGGAPRTDGRGNRRFVRCQRPHDCQRTQLGRGPAHYCLGHAQSRSHAGSHGGGRVGFRDVPRVEHERSSRWSAGGRS